MQKINNTNFKKIYIAAPLFSEAELRFNKYLKSILNQFFEVFLPQEDGGFMFTLIKNGMEPKVAAKTVFQNDIKAIEKCDYFLIILDGKIVDEGAAFELGIAYTLNKKCIGLQTDIRRLSSIELNPMLSNSIKPIFNTIEELLKWIKTEILKNNNDFHLKI